MSWVPVVIVGLVVAMLVGPVMMNLPSKRESYLAKLRAAANKLGFRVQLTTLTGFGGSDNQQNLAAYRLLWRNKINVSGWRLLRAGYEHEMHFCLHWVWDDKQPDLPGPILNWLTQHLPAMPDTVRAVGVDNAGVVLYWSEKGGEEALQKLFQIASDLREQVATTYS